jgi:hypothetical protein
VRPKHVAVVVEGQGDAAAVPILLKRIMAARGLDVALGKPVSCSGRPRALQAEGIERFVTAAVSRPGCAAVAVILDGEGDPVCELGPRLAGRVQAVTHLPALVALAEDQFENWLLCSAETLRLAEVTYGRASDPSSVLRRGLGGRKYVKPVWQPRLTERLDS